MPRRHPLSEIILNDVPDSPGAVVLLDDAQPLYVAQTGNLRAWVRRLVDTRDNDYVRQRIARFVGAGLFEKLGSGGTPPVLDEQVQAFLLFCKVELYPERDRGAALKRKAALVASLNPRLQTPRARRESATERSDDPAPQAVRTLMQKVASQLSHTDEEGRARMVDISAKADTAREAVARGLVRMQPETLAMIQSGGVPKGDVIGVARLAGVMAAKHTHELIPLCHPLLLTDIDVEITPDAAASALRITATVRTTGKTGVEMEALTAVSVAALTVYDMCKAVDRGMRVESIRLAEKRGGKSGEIVLE